MDQTELIYDWNVRGARGAVHRPDIELNDETLRDGLQSPSVRAPTLDEKLHILHYMADLGIHGVNIGLPGAGPQVARDVTALARDIVGEQLRIVPNCAARTLQVDIEPIVDASQAA